MGADCNSDTLLKQALTEVTGGILIVDKSGETVMNSLRFEARKLYEEAGDKVDGMETHLASGDHILMRRRSLGDGTTLVFAEKVTELRQTEEELWRLVHTDPLTGLENMVSLRHHLNDALAVSGRYGRPFTVMRMVISEPADFMSSEFKDRIIIHVGKVVRHGLRVVDHLAHLGDGHFLAYLPETCEDSAKIVSERLSERLARSSMQQDGRSIEVAATCGIAPATDDDTDADAVIARAESALGGR